MAIDQTPKITKLRIIKNLLLISLAFFLLFTAWDGLSMLQSTMNKKEGIGVISQAVGYISFCMASLLLPKYIIKKIGCKASLVLSLSLFIPAVASNFHPTWYIMMPSAVLGGLGAAILWGAQCTYFNESSFRYAGLITSGTANRNQPMEISSVCTSVETLSVGNSICDIIDKNPLKSSSSIQDNLDVTNLQDCVVRYKCNNYIYGNMNEIESNYSQYIGKIVENSNKEEGKSYHSEYSVHNDHSLMPEGICRTQGGIEKKEPQESSKISNVEGIVKNVVEDVSGLINNGISKLHEESAAPKVNTNSKSVFQKANTLESVTGLFFAFHSIAYYSAQILSNGISYFVLKGGDDDLMNYSDGCSCGSQFCNTPGCVNDETEYVSKKLRYLLTGISVAIGAVSILLVILFIDPLKKAKSDDEPEKISLRLISATISHNKKKEQLCLIPISFFEGMQQGFYTADFTKSYVGCAWGASNVGLVSVFYGTACVVSTLASGILVKYAGRKPLFFVGQILIILMLSFLLFWKPNSDFTLGFHIAGILFGTITGIYWSQLLAFYGLLFKKDEEAAFASYYLWSSLGWTASFLYSDYICTYIKIYLLLIVSIIGTAGYLYTERFYEKHMRQRNVMAAQ